jgi:hypothetical protein
MSQPMEVLARAGENDVGTAKAFQFGSLSIPVYFIVIVLWLWFSPVFSLAYRWDAHRPHGFWRFTKLLDTFTVGWKVDDTCGLIVELCLSSERILQLLLFPQVCSAPAEWPCGTESNITRTRRWSVSEIFTAQR